MVLTYPMLERAWRKEVSGKHEMRNQAIFEYYRENKLFALKDALIDGSFEPSPLRTKEIYIPKRRTAQVPGAVDKIVQHLLCDEYLYDAVTRPLIDTTYACMSGRGTKLADHVLKEQLRRFWRLYHKKPLILKCDIHSYFASIDHERLFGLVERYVKDDIVKTNVMKFLGLSGSDTGLPLGLQQNQLLANLFLSELDHMIKQKWHAEFYGRYMDDFYIISGDMEYLQKLLEDITDYAGGIGLEMNPKTGICKGRFDFLGFSYLVTDTGKVVKRLAKSKRKTERNYVRLMARQIGEGKRDTESAEQSYRSWREHAMQGDCYSLIRSMDKHFDDELRKVGYTLSIKPYRKNGKRKEQVIIEKCHEQSPSLVPEQKSTTM